MAAIVFAHLIAQRVLMGADMLVVLIVTVIVLVALAAVLVAVIVVHSTVLAVALVAVIAVHTPAQERVKQIVKMTAPAPVQDLVSGRALIIAKIHVQDIARAAAQPDVLHVMVAVIAAVATEVAVQDATHHAMHLLIVSQH